MHLHVLGICGTFMGGLAALAREAGHRVTGCDANVYPPMSDQLKALGIELIEGYDASQLKLAPEESPYWGPIKNFPASIGAADRVRLTGEYRDSIANVICRFREKRAVVVTATMALITASGGAEAETSERMKKPADIASVTNEGSASCNEPAATIAVAHAMPVPAR